MKTIVIDQNAHDILMWCKEQCKSDGIEKPTLSEAIRWLKREYDELLEQKIYMTKKANRTQ